MSRPSPISDRLTESTMSETQQFQVAADCPQCGGGIEFEEEASVIRCNYCGSALLLGNRQGVVRYTVEPRIRVEDLNRLVTRVIYKQTGRSITRLLEQRSLKAPFWRIRGNVFRWILGRRKTSGSEAALGATAQYEKDLKARWLDFTFPAYQKPDVGLYSLGVRASVIQLRYFSPSSRDHEAEFIKVDVPVKQALLRGLRAMRAGLASSKVKQPEMERIELIGERASLIYFPLWVVSCAYPRGSATLIIDALGGDVLKAWWDGVEKVQVHSGAWLDKAAGLGPVQFLPFRCPECGWDLPFHPYNTIHVCRNCHRAWNENHGRLVEVDYFAVDPPKAAKHKWAFLPFWTFRGVIVHRNHRVENMAQLLRLTVPPRVVDFQAEAQNPIRFFIPAFKSRGLSHLNRMAHILVLRTPSRSYIPRHRLEEKNLMGVYLPQEEARQMARIVVFSLIPAGNRQARQVLGRGKLELYEPCLEWFPFAVSKHNYTEALSGFALARNSVEVS
ncbi:MAG: hypothetical protein JRG73_17935 [Deltaproteobacteria bacterium]|nr:hypothetical protein [Deltaproteobacteria bacterium]